MATYEIIQSETGHSFGAYEAETPDAAIAAMLADAGHDGPADHGLRAVLAINADSIVEAAEAHVADVLAQGHVAASDLAAESDDAALATWDASGILTAAGLPSDASAVDFARARAVLAQAIRDAAEERA